MSNRTSPQWTNETYKGMTTIAGILTFLIVMCNRLTIYIRVSLQVVLGIALIGVLTGCYRVHDRLRIEDPSVKSRKAMAFLVKGITFAITSALLLFIHIIPIVPMLAKASVSAFGMVFWLRLFHWTPKPKERSEKS